MSDSGVELTDTFAQVPQENESQEQQSQKDETKTENQVDFQTQEVPTPTKASEDDSETAPEAQKETQKEDPKENPDEEPRQEHHHHHHEEKIEIKIETVNDTTTDVVMTITSTSTSDGSDGDDEKKEDGAEKVGEEAKDVTPAPIPDPKTPAGRLFAQMVSVVGDDNILRPPADLQGDAAERFLMNDANALVYFWSRSKQAHTRIQKQVSRPACSHFCWDHQDNCRIESYWVCCFVFCCPCASCMAICNCCSWPTFAGPVSTDGKTLVGTHFGNRYYYDGSEAEFNRLESGLSRAAMLEYRHKSIYEPLNALEMKCVSDSWLCCNCWACVCSPCYKARYNNILHSYLDERYGQEVFSLETFLTTLGTKRERESFNPLKDLRSFYDMRRDKIDETITHHNAKWGHLHKISVEGLDMDAIFVRGAAAKSK